MAVCLKGRRLVRKAAQPKVGLSSHILHRSYPSGLIVVITKNKKYKSKDGDDDNVKKTRFQDGAHDDDLQQVRG